MARDFRPKGKGGAAAGARRAKPRASGDDPALDDIEALGGTADDLRLINSESDGAFGKQDDAELASAVQQFMQQEAPELAARAPAKRADAGGRAERRDARGKAHHAEERRGKHDRSGKGQPIGEESAAQAERHKSGGKKDRNGHNDKGGAPHGRPGKPEPQGRPTQTQAPAPSAAPAPRKSHVVFDSEGSAHQAKASVTPRSLLISPVPEWTQLHLPPLQPPKGAKPGGPSEADIVELHSLGEQALEAENATYSRLATDENTRNITLGSLSGSDLQFARTLLSSTKGSTLSDRISALTLLLQSSPIHNLKSLETLMGMAGKPNREEAGRATRSLADWFASGGGLGEQKLNYFRDQPGLGDAAAVLHNKPSAEQRRTVQEHACLWAFEDVLKRTYFAFVQLLERQSHDPLLFMRKQAVYQIFVLLRDKPEQEHNLLRLLTNKLGDPDRSVASKASTHLMELLQAHPAMKAIVLREVSGTVLQAQLAAVRRAAGAPQEAHRLNQHATYYGVLTLNQTLFTAQDAPVANELFSVYFQLFEACLAHDHADEEEKQEEQAEPKCDKKRWRDAHKRGPHDRERENKSAANVEGRLLAAILTGVRRVFPFTTLDTDAVDKHLDTLFRITHTHSFNLAIQALQLIFQVAVAMPTDGASARGFSPAVSDRFYRTLYDSLLDTRLVTTSKQAMYLNLLYKALKQDSDTERVKAFVKRICQILNMHEPPFICGAMVLLGELFRALPGLRAMITEPEEEGEEHFYDQPDEEDEPRDGDAPAAQTKAPSAPSGAAAYDGRKRDPRFAHAGETALWDLLPLVRHFHPTVSLHAMQLLRGEKVTSTTDLTLNTLTHFLDRFVYRNPKKRTGLKGSSIMQPALSGSIADGDMVVRRSAQSAVPLDNVNTEAFWTQRPENIPVDQQFFHRFFQAKMNRGQAPRTKPEKPEADEEAADEEGEEAAEDVPDDLSTEDEEEKEIWRAMKASMPSEKEMGEVSDDDDDELIEALENEGEDDDGASEGDEEVGDEDEEGEEEEDQEGEEPEDEEPDEGDEDEGFEEGEMPFAEDEEDLVPFTNFDEEEQAATGTKRSAEEDADDGQPMSKSKRIKEQRKKRRAMPDFASAEDFAHMLPSDDEGGE